MQTAVSRTFSAESNIFPSAELELAVYKERVALLYDGVIPTTLAAITVFLSLTYVNWHVIDHAVLYSWCAYMLIVISFRASITYFFHKHPPQQVSDVLMWARTYHLSIALIALGWGFTGGILLSEDSLIQQMFIVISLAGLSAGALATLTSVFSVYVIFLLLTMLPLLSKLISFNDNIHLVTATLVSIFILFALSSAKRMANTIIKSISLRHMHDAALNDIADKVHHTDELNKNLQQQINEREIAEQHLENSMSQLKATLESTSDGILVLDNQNNITNFNNRFLHLFHIEDNLIQSMDFTNIQNHIQGLLKNGEKTLLTQDTKEQTFELADGRYIEKYWNPQIITDQTVGGVFCFRDATSRITSEYSLQKAKFQAEKSNNEKSEFLSRISHELRTPLNAILGFGELLKENEKQHLDHEEKSYVDNICTAGGHLLNLIDDLLDISRIESGKLNINLKPTSCHELINDCLALVQKSTEENNIKIINKSDLTNLPDILADQTRSKQALVNLLSNAIKYNRNNGSINITAYVRDTFIRIEIQDTGLGIPRDNLDDIFQPFIRLKQNEKTKGTGIGLTITKRLVEVMDGRIGVNSEVDKGSIFWFELPISTDKKLTKTPKPTKTQTHKQGSNLNSKTILYIEDEPLNQALVRSIIKAIDNIDLILASTGEEGIEMAFDKKPDLILMDLNLPGISGYEALTAIKQDHRFQSTPVFAVTANAMPDEIERGKAVGFTDYLIKPINIENTRTLLRNTLHN